MSHSRATELQARGLLRRNRDSMEARVWCTCQYVGGTAEESSLDQDMAQWVLVLVAKPD